MSIGDNIRKLRFKSKMSQREVSFLLGIDKNTYCSWENNITDVKAYFIPKLAEVFNVNINDLFGLDIKAEISLTKQTSYCNSNCNCIVINLPDKESVNLLAQALQSKLDRLDK